VTRPRPRPHSSGQPSQRIEVTIEKIVAGGYGLARTPEVVLVPRVAPGERVVVELDRGRKPPRGRVLKILERSPSRVEPPCIVVDKCGGCDLMHLSPDAQREAHLEILREALPASMRDFPITHHAATPPRGRTRARWHAKTLGDGAGLRTIVGYRAASSQTIVPIEECVAIDPRLVGALSDARKILEGARGDGEVHAALGASGRPVLAIAWKGELAGPGYRAAEERVRGGHLAGVEIALDGARIPATIGDPRPMSLPRDGLPFIAPPRGFAQASEVGDAVLVDRVVDRAEVAGQRVVELFAGSGNLTVRLAREAAQLTAIEIDAAACRAAQENVAVRALGAKVKILAADADDTPIPPQTDVVVLDPPRHGAPGAVKAIAERKPRRVVYVSCDPPTLGRDLAVLLAAGYSPVAIDAIDLFPDTSHVETIVTLVRGPK
jgi:23S rRNA (uracil1939-C5)-methyltransferase